MNRSLSPSHTTAGQEVKCPVQGRQRFGPTLRSSRPSKVIQQGSNIRSRLMLRCHAICIATTPCRTVAPRQRGLKRDPIDERTQTCNHNCLCTSRQHQPSDACSRSLVPAYALAVGQVRRSQFLARTANRSMFSYASILFHKAATISVGLDVLTLESTGPVEFTSYGIGDQIAKLDRHARPPTHVGNLASRLRQAREKIILHRSTASPPCPSILWTSLGANRRVHAYRHQRPRQFGRVGFTSPAEGEMIPRSVSAPRHQRRNARRQRPDSLATSRRYFRRRRPACARYELRHESR